jgi:predicted permease
MIGFLLIGYMLRRVLPKYAMTYAHRFITFVAMPFLIITSVSGSQLIEHLWLAPLISVVAIAIGGIFALIAIDISKINENVRTLWHSSKLIDVLDANAHYHNIANNSISHSSRSSRQKPFKKSLSQQTLWHSKLQPIFLIAASKNNGGYIAFPIILLLLNNNYSQYFTVAVISDLFSVVIGIYVLLKILKYDLYKTSDNQSYDPNSDIYVIDRHDIYPDMSTTKTGKKISDLDTKSDFNKFLYSLTGSNFKVILGSLIVGIIINIFIKNDLPNIILQSKSLMIQMYLIALGIQMNFSRWKFYPSQVTSCLVVKMLAMPMAIAAFLAFLGLDKLMAITILIMVAMPPLLTDSQICKQYGLPVEFQVSCYSTGLIIMAFTLPLWMALFS